MCGIIGAIADHDVVPAVLGGLQRIEYRGYDSAGMAVVDGRITRIRKKGKVLQLAAAVERARLSGTLAVGHTRWATHGPATERNAHPHVSREEVVVVHNGIIENFRELRAELERAGYRFASDTDTEVVAHLVHYYSAWQSDLLHAVREAVRRLRGAYALVVCSVKDTERIIAVRQGAPLLVGLGEHGNFAASDKQAVVHETRTVVYLENGDIADIGRGSVSIFDKEGRAVKRAVHTLDASEEADRGQYASFMDKEIHEQPKALADTIARALTDGISPALFGAGEEVFSAVESVHFIACGTSSYAGRVAQLWTRSLAGIPAHAEIASEYRVGDVVPNPRTLIVTVSQSGETADTMEALRRAKELGHEWTLSICNVAESSIPRESRFVYYTRAGTEVGVASTKAFTTQLSALFILALALAKAKGRLGREQEEHYLGMLRRIPASVQHALDLEPQIRLWARDFAHKQHALFLGRGVHHPVALEGALKLKEISYIHAEGYPAGELKHGPIALVDEHMPVVVIAPNDELFGKIESNISEVRARKAQLYVFTDEGSTYEASEGIRVIRVPRHDGILSPIVHAVPVQLLAYHTALLMGRDVDKPRNLAKSVTVE
jgi:glutamine---fructose-6-phosphate transaminase (isomerizing)